MSDAAVGGALYLVATPIGNLADMTFRAVAVLKSASTIAAEDTRRTGKLLQHFEIATPQISFHEHNQRQRCAQLIPRLQGGESIALVSDAGTPGISDPGYELVRACIEAGIPVIPIPGATAAIAGLIASGLPSDRFVFEGFLPGKAKDRRARLESCQNETRTLVFYEAPHRLLATLQEMANCFGSDRPAVLARELTKVHEEFWRGTLAAAIVHYQEHPPRGEFVIAIGGAPAAAPILLTTAELKQELQALLAEGLSRSQASRQLAQVTGLSRREIYQLDLASDSPAPDSQASVEPL